MLALAMVVKKANIMPHFNLVSSVSALQHLNNAELRVVRDAVAAMPDELVQKGDSKMGIMDTGCTISASGEKSD